MMNLLALSLVLSSIAVASFFSPPPDPDHQVLREGHRLIIVEYERQIPQSSSLPSSPSEIAGEAQENLLGQGLSQPTKGKHSIFTDTKKKASQLEESASDAMKSVAEKLNNKATQIEESISDAVKSTAEKAKEKSVQIEESASVALKTAAEKAKQKTAQLQVSAGKAAKSAVAASEDVAGNISASAERTAGMAVEATGEIRRNLSDILQRAWELGRDVAAFVGAGVIEAARSAAAVAHLLGFAMAYGTCVWVTFASNNVLASAMPRQQLGIVQSRIYPVYFRFLALAVGVGLAGHVLGREERVQGYNLMATLAIVILNLVWLEPKATKAMFDRMKLEKEEGRGRALVDFATEPAMPGAHTETTTPVADALTIRKASAKGRMSELTKRLKSLNDYSSFLNVLTLMGLSWHLVYLA